ncbi:hypothetical protein RUM44_011232 [Polyplax serrata]|uniref:CCHC NOA-type domain-containing protein n=1 Tax=Polyplax serrata TaxID=468196 RepID=A0ABR1AR78_POLSC
MASEVRFVSLNMSEESANEPLSDASNSSFVILGPGSFTNVSNDESLKNIIGENNNVEISTSKRDTIDSAKNALSATTFHIDTDVQQKLSQLIRENYQLKETLSQNNLAIKTQLNIFFMWQQEVLKTHETHKQKFLETKDMILKLRSENLNLKMQLEKNSANSSLGNGNPLECENSGFSLLEKMKVSNTEIEKLMADVKKFEHMNNDLQKMNDKLSLENYDLQKTIEDSKQEILKINKELKDVEKENMYLKQKSCEQQSTPPTSLLPNSEARMQISNLLKQLEEERALVAKLKKELENSKSSSGNPEVNKNPKDELNHYLNELNEMDASFEKQSQRINGLSSWIYLAEENLTSRTMNKTDDNQIMLEIDLLKSQLNEEKNAVKKTEESLQDIYIQFNRILKDYKELEEKFKSLESQNRNMDKHKSDIENLTIELEFRDLKLKEKEDEVTRLRETIGKLNLECEELAILRVQADVYRSDFHDERAAREKLVGEKETMAEQIRLLEAVIRDLEREHPIEQKQQEENSTPKSPLETKNSRYVCPKCMFAFSDLKLCEEHVDECIDTHFYP